MHRRHRSELGLTLVVAVASVLFLMPGAARADVLWDWTDAAVTAAAGAKQLPFEQTRTLTILHVAMFNAVDGVERSYAPYGSAPAPASGASPEAAAAAAGEAVLSGLFPEQRATWEALLASSLARVPGGGPRQGGLDLGARVGAAVVGLRSQDGADAPNSYRPHTTPGAYVPTVLPVGSGWGQVTPWAMKAGSQFRPGPPPELTSAVWTRDLNELKTVGGKHSEARTPTQTEVARFWSIVGPASWLPVVRALGAAPGRSLVQNARLLALVSMATADSYISVMDAKYHYQFWRPITAIRYGIEGHEAAPSEATWEPLIDTPLHPEYPCAHCINSGAAAAVLEGEFGTGELPAFRMTSAALPGVTHQWTRIRDYAAEVSNARIWGGIHYRNSTEVGAAMGRQIGEWTLRTQLGPQGGTHPTK